ncbi:hypothetical protein KIF59_19025 [Enterobacter cloacae subsp. cloacae]|nr:hypothetical protein [Enterobacter cloacae subsp. cloacae]
MLISSGERGEIFARSAKRRGEITTFKMMCGLLVPTSGKSAGTGYGFESQLGQAAPASGVYGAKVPAVRQPDGRAEPTFSPASTVMPGARAQNEKSSA